MPRPRTAPGSWGTITVVGQVQSDGKWITAPTGTKPTRWRARTKVRDLDGKLRDVERFAATKGRAEAALKAELSQRTEPRRGDSLRAETTLTKAAAHWLEQIRRPESGLAASTVEQYEAAWHRYIATEPIASMTLREVNRVPPVRGLLQRIADERGAGAAKTARTVLALIVGLAVHEGLFDVNAVRQVRTPGAARKAAPARTISDARLRRLTDAGADLSEAGRDTRRAFTREERERLLTFAAQDHEAQHADVVDLVRFMAGTGVRISEALGQAWQDVDLAAGKVLVRGTKTDASTRTITLAPWLHDALSVRYAAQGEPSVGLVFPSPRTGGLRDRRNAARALRALFDRAGFPWATPHSLRRTVATLLDEAGMPIALAANVLGHADPSMTARVYLGRKGDTAAAAAVL